MAIRWIFGDVMPYDMIGDVPVIFVHIPKNAGTSVKKYFNIERSCHQTLQEMYKKYFIDKEGIQFYDSGLGGREYEILLEKKKKLLLFFKSLDSLYNIWDPAFKFSFVRNPWDRISSIYHYHREDFSEFQNFECVLRALELKSTPFEKGVLSYTQTEFLSVGGEIELNFLGKYENLKKDVENLYQYLTDEEAKEFDISERRSDNNKSHYTEMYENFDSIYTVFRYFYDDVINFKYTFNNEPNCEQTRKCFERYREEILCTN